MKTSIIIPCFNEEANLDKLFKSWLSAITTEDIEVIFVNNGSKDNSKIIFNELETKYINFKKKFKIIHLPENRGYGGGIQEGLNQATGEFLGWCHADNQVEVKDVLNLINAIYLLNNDNVLLKGSRKNRNSFDNFFTIVMSLFVKIFTNENLKDINAQPKIFPNKFYKKNKEYSSDFLFDLDFLLDAIKEGREVREIKVTNLERKQGKAKGGGSLKGKLSLSVRTIKYLLTYRKKCILKS